MTLYKFNELTKSERATSMNIIHTASFKDARRGKDHVLKDASISWHYSVFIKAGIC